jgi:hypothetical protein
MKWQVNYIQFYMQMSRIVVNLRHFNDTKMQQRERQTSIKTEFAQFKTPLV